MTDTGRVIDLKLSEKLLDPVYRKAFFWAEASAEIASGIIALRKRRGLSQKEVADLTHTKQSAISRVERADYQNWSFNTLRVIADALNARIRVIIQPAEDVLVEYGHNDQRSLDPAEVSIAMERPYSTAQGERYPVEQTRNYVHKIIPQGAFLHAVNDFDEAQGDFSTMIAPIKIRGQTVGRISSYEGGRADPSVQQSLYGNAL